MKKIVFVAMCLLITATVMQACTAARCPAYKSYPSRRQ